MGMPVQLLSRYHPGDEKERAVHFYARECQATLRWLVRALILITALTAITFWFWAIIPATFLMITYGLYMIANVIEKRSSDRRLRAIEEREISVGPPEAMAATEIERAEAEPLEEEAAVVELGEAELEPPTRDVPMRVIKHETIVVAVAVLAVLILATVLAAIAWGWGLILFAVPVLFVYIILMSWPVWFAALEEDLEHESHEVEESVTGTGPGESPGA